MADETGQSGATPDNGPDPGSGAMPAGQQDPPSAGGGSQGAMPDPSLGDAGQAALNQERVARRDAERQAAEFRRRLSELEDAGKSELERAQAQLKRSESERDEHARRIAELEESVRTRDLADLKRQVATEHNLPAEMADRLVGSDLRTLRADAKTFADTLKAKTVGSLGIGQGGTVGGRGRGPGMSDLIREAAGRGGG